MFCGDVPVGSGLSSSAALEIVFCITAKLLNKLDINMINVIKALSTCRKQICWC